MNSYRTHTCSELRAANIGKPTTLIGWVDSVRDHGGVIFIDLRDRSGITQVVFHPEVNQDVAKASQQLRSEDMIQISGTVAARLKTDTVDTTNADLPTGEIEVSADTLNVINKADVLPFQLDRALSNEDLRLKYRFLDLRRPAMARNMQIRHRVTKATRDYLDEHGFLEIETPILSKSTPEGARDFLVPSRLAPGKFYALPQAPQQYKQLLMVAGMERYFQIARCFRDEDLRAQAYDVVLNGTELGGGSIRIHERDLQSAMFKALGITEEQAREQFGHILDAFSFGAPPHGGLALGLDRLVMMICNAESIREVIAFPKNNRGADLMSDSPAAAEDRQLRDIHIQVKLPAKK